MAQVKGFMPSEWSLNREEARLVIGNGKFRAQAERKAVQLEACLLQQRNMLWAANSPVEFRFYGAFGCSYSDGEYSNFQCISRWAALRGMTGIRSELSRQLLIARYVLRNVVFGQTG